MWRVGYSDFGTKQIIEHCLEVIDFSPIDLEADTAVVVKQITGMTKPPGWKPFIYYEVKE